MEEPETGYVLDVWGEFGEAVDSGEDAGYVVGLLGDSWRYGGICMCHWVWCSHLVVGFRLRDVCPCLEMLLLRGV